jgi:hypothetical protein
MKKLIALLFIPGLFTFVACGPCENSSQESSSSSTSSSRSNLVPKQSENILELSGTRFHIVKIRNCEYIVTENSNNYIVEIIHAEDCENEMHQHEQTPSSDEY